VQSWLCCICTASTPAETRSCKECCCLTAWLPTIYHNPNSLHPHQLGQDPASAANLTACRQHPPPCGGTWHLSYTSTVYCTYLEGTLHKHYTACTTRTWSGVRPSTSHHSTAQQQINTSWQPPQHMQDGLPHDCIESLCAEPLHLSRLPHQLRQVPANASKLTACHSQPPP
jgi:hypothetical protein